jgi:hypothetical protein
MIAARHPIVAVDDLPFKIVTEYQEQPGLRLTFSQVQRLWCLPARDCHEVLEYLVDTRKLVCGEDGRYRLSEECDEDLSRG